MEYPDDFIGRVINADCLEILKQIPNESVDLVLTDPPYGIGIHKMSFVTSGRGKIGGAYRNDYSNHDTKWDEKPISSEQLKEIMRISKNQIIFGANYFAHLMLPSNHWIVWDKRCNDKYSNDFADCELIWTSFDTPSKIIRYLWSGMLQQNMKYKEKRVHPTQKPLELIRKLVSIYSNENNIVLDPFLGSGTTAVACKQLGRQFIGIEIDKNYCEIAEKRLASIPQKLNRWFE